MVNFFLNKRETVLVNVLLLAAIYGLIKLVDAVNHSDGWLPSALKECCVYFMLAVELVVALAVVAVPIYIVMLLGWGGLTSSRMAWRKTEERR